MLLNDKGRIIEEKGKMKESGENYITWSTEDIISVGFIQQSLNENE